MEVVNRKRVRVHLFPYQAEGGVSSATFFKSSSYLDCFFYLFWFQSILWFNIDSVGSLLTSQYKFVVDLEKAQIEMSEMEPPNFVPVVYKREIDSSTLTELLLINYFFSRRSIIGLIVLYLVL